MGTKQPFAYKKHVIKKLSIIVNSVAKLSLSVSDILTNNNVLSAYYDMRPFYGYFYGIFAFILLLKMKISRNHGRRALYRSGWGKSNQGPTADDIWVYMGLQSIVDANKSLLSCHQSCITTA